VPDLLRKIFLSDEESGTGRDPGSAADPLAFWDQAAAWQTAPVALATVQQEQVRAWNNACRTLLREVVGGTEIAGRRWLTAAVVRLLVTGRSSEVLAGGDNTLSLEIRLGPVIPDSLLRVVALREVKTDGAEQTDLFETISTLSHELRTPLTSINSSLNLVLAGEAGPVNADQARFLGMTLRNIDRLDRLVSDLLDVSRSQVGELELHRQRVDLGPVLSEAMQLQEATARQVGLDLDYTGLPAKLVAHVDADKMVQILTNVVGNSIKYTPAGGLVRVWLEPRPRLDPEPEPSLAWRLAKKCFLPLNTFNLVVEDSGVGMSREDLDRVFEPWFRGREDDRGRIPGAGLGLHITRSLVEAHGGRIRLASEPGQGTTVWIRMPRDPVSEELLHGSRQLRAMAENWVAANVAVLDARLASGQLPGSVKQMAADFLHQLPGGGDRKIVSLAPDLVATVVSEPKAWQDAWTAFQKTNGSTTSAIRWQFVTWPGPRSNKVSIVRQLSRNL